MANYQLAEFRSVTLDANGSATVAGVGPVLYGETWKVERISVSTTVRCKFTVYRGRDTSPQYQVDGTVRGDLDTSETNLSLQSGDSLSFKWENGANDAKGSVRIEGVRIVRGR